MSTMWRQTLGSYSWMVANEDRVKALLPQELTLIDQAMALRIGFGFKLLGIDWRSHDEFGAVMVMLEKIGVMLREGMKIQANPRRTFPLPKKLQEAK